MKKSTKFIFAGVFGVLFLALYVMVRLVDVQAIGPEGTAVGLAGINGRFHESRGVHLFLYDLTNYMGYATLCLVPVFGLLGLVQLIQRKNLWKVDHCILALGELYLIDLAVYFFFEKVPVNYRPVMMAGETMPEASFPSSHTILGVTVMVSAMLILDRYVRDYRNRKALYAFGSVFTLVMVCGRMASGVHWFTDILAAVCLSACLLFLFAGVIHMAEEEE